MTHSLIRGATVSIAVTHISSKGENIGFDSGRWELLTKTNKNVLNSATFTTSPMLIPSTATINLYENCVLRIWLYKGSFVTIEDIELEISR